MLLNGYIYNKGCKKTFTGTKLAIILMYKNVTPIIKSEILSVFRSCFKIFVKLIDLDEKWSTFLSATL